jgi:hypothetical protein
MGALGAKRKEKRMLAKVGPSIGKLDKARVFLYLAQKGICAFLRE